MSYKRPESDALPQNGNGKHKGVLDRRNPYNDQFYTGPERRRIRAGLTPDEYEELHAESVYYERSARYAAPDSHYHDDAEFSGQERGQDENEWKDSDRYEKTQSGHAPVNGHQSALYKRLVANVFSRGLNFGADVINEVGVRRVNDGNGAVSVSLGESNRPITDPFLELQGKDMPSEAAGSAYSFDSMLRRGGGVASDEEDKPSGSRVDYSI